MISWVIKMLLKFMKPFLKIALITGLLDSILNLGGDETSDDPTEGTSDESVTE